MLDALRRRLEDLRARDLERRPETGSGIDFTSNDYLGLGRRAASIDELRRRLAEPDVRTLGLGAPASRLLRGQTRAHDRLERRFARWLGTEASVLYPSGWQANLGLLTAVVRPADRVISDAANHASIIDALRLVRCRRVIVPHLDLDAVARALAEPPTAADEGGQTFLVTESLFSMDGDTAPLDRYAELCERHGAELIVDEAHGTGLWGERGAGLVEHYGLADRVLAVTSTGGKALGLGGAFVSGPAVLRDLLVSTSRPFVFSTAVPPLLAHALDIALDAVEAEPWRRRRMHEMADRLRRGLRERRVGGLLEPGPLGGPIVPVIVGENRAALAIAAEIRRHGYDVRAVRPPTVAEGTARLRISVHADHDEATIDGLAEAVARAMGAESETVAGAAANDRTEPEPEQSSTPEQGKTPERVGARP